MFFSTSTIPDGSQASGPAAARFSQFFHNICIYIYAAYERVIQLKRGLEQWNEVQKRLRRGRVKGPGAPGRLRLTEMKQEEYAQSSQGHTVPAFQHGRVRADGHAGSEI